MYNMHYMPCVRAKFSGRAVRIREASSARVWISNCMWHSMTSGQMCPGYLQHILAVLFLQVYSLLNIEDAIIIMASWSMYHFVLPIVFGNVPTYQRVLSMKQFDV